MDAVDGVPRCVLQSLVDGLPAGNEVDVDRLNLLAGDQAERRIAGGGDEIEAALVHERDHLVGGSGRLDVDLAARLLLEGGDPVIILIGLAALDVAGPGNDIDLAFTLADGLSAFRQARRRREQAGRRKMLRHSVWVSYFLTPEET